MFGFGVSKLDKEILETAEAMLSTYSNAGFDIRSLVKSALNEVKSEIERTKGRHAIYFESAGDFLVNQGDFITPRLNDGLTKEDVRLHWNRSFVIPIFERKIDEMANMFVFEISRRRGLGEGEIIEVLREVRRQQVVYGMPDAFDENIPIYQGFSSVDADIFPEFRMRIFKWTNKIPESRQNDIRKNFTSYNAMIRHLVRHGGL